jgi:hypothetical protein
MGTGDGGNTCSGCILVTSSFYRRCRSAVEFWGKDFDENTTNKSLLMSPSLAQKRFQYDKSTKKSYQNRIFQLEAQRQRKKGVRLPFDMMDLFDSETEALAEIHFKQQGLTDDDVSRLIFYESLKNARVAKQSGSRRVRHSPLMIRFCISLNHKLGKRDWKSISKAFHMPSQSTLDKHKSIGSNDPDGFYHSIVHGESKHMEKVQADEKLSSEFKAWVCHGGLSYDSAKCRDKIIYNYHTGELMGYAHDAFDVNLIQAEWKQAAKNAEAKNGGASAKKESKPKLAKHFLLFYFTSWESRSRKTQMCVARYGMDSIMGSWLAKEIRKIIACLDVYGFLVNSIVADGASENRSCNNQLATLSVSDVIALTPAQSGKLPANKKIAFYHPAHAGISLHLE